MLYSLDMMASFRSITYSICVCVLLQVNDFCFNSFLMKLFFDVFQIVAPEAVRSADERLKRITKSELTATKAIFNEYFLDSKTLHDNIISDTNQFIQQYRNRFFKNYNFNSAKVANCLKQYLQSQGPIEAQECSQSEAYDSLKKQIFRKVLVYFKFVIIVNFFCALDFRKNHRG